jgi:CheY-like chemotaxis protein
MDIGRRPEHAGILATPHVLVVDDEPMVLELVSRILETEGLSVSTAADGRRAIDLVRQDADICLAVLDWRMPEMTGEQVLDEVAVIRPNIKAVVMSGSDPLEIERAFAGRRIYGFVRKPFKSKNLMQAVKSALAA